jgi:hypothetical protein
MALNQNTYRNIIGPKLIDGVFRRYSDEGLTKELTSSKATSITAEEHESFKQEIMDKVGPIDEGKPHISLLMIYERSEIPDEDFIQQLNKQDAYNYNIVESIYNFKYKLTPLKQVNFLLQMYISRDVANNPGDFVYNLYVHCLYGMNGQVGGADGDDEVKTQPQPEAEAESEAEAEAEAEVEVEGEVEGEVEAEAEGEAESEAEAEGEEIINTLATLEYIVNYNIEESDTQEGPLRELVHILLMTYGDVKEEMLFKLKKSGYDIKVGVKQVKTEAGEESGDADDDNEVLPLTELQGSDEDFKSRNGEKCDSANDCETGLECINNECTNPSDGVGDALFDDVEVVGDEKRAERAAAKAEDVEVLPLTELQGNDEDFKSRSGEKCDSTNDCETGLECINKECANPSEGAGAALFDDVEVVGDEKRAERAAAKAEDVEVLPLTELQGNDEDFKSRSGEKCASTNDCETGLECINKECANPDEGVGAALFDDVEVVGDKKRAERAAAKAKDVEVLPLTELQGNDDEDFKGREGDTCAVTDDCETGLNCKDSKCVSKTAAQVAREAYDAAGEAVAAEAAAAVATRSSSVSPRANRVAKAKMGKVAREVDRIERSTSPGRQRPTRVRGATKDSNGKLTHDKPFRTGGKRTRKQKMKQTKKNKQNKKNKRTQSKQNKRVRFSRRLPKRR